MSAEKTVYVVDDNKEFLESTAWLLEGLGFDVETYDQPSVAFDALKDLRANGSRCLMLDVRMPGMSGLDLHDTLNDQKVNVPVVYMTGHGDVPLAVEAMKKGAVTFLEKPLQEDALEAALKAAFSATRQIRLNDGAEEDKIRDFKERLTTLTPRETEIMNHIVNGHPNKVIAIDLDISIKTVEMHRSRLMKKMSVTSGPDLVRLVMLCQ